MFKNRILFLCLLMLPVLYNNCAKQTTRAFKGDPQELLSENDPSSNLDNDDALPVKPSLELGMETELFWSDEFDSFEGQWTDFFPGQMAPGYQYSAETWFPVPNPLASVADGMMHLASRPCDSAPAGTNKCGVEISTRTSFNNFTHGHLEVRMQFPANVDRSSGFWLLGAFDDGDNKWPKNGEIDIVLFQNTSSLSLNSNPYGRLSWFGENCTSNVCRMDFPTELSVNYRFAYHVWSITRTSDLLEVFVDEQLFFRVTPEDFAALGGDYRVIFDGPMSIRARNQSGLDTTLSAKRQVMSFDYIRAWHFMEP